MSVFAPGSDERLRREGSAPRALCRYVGRAWRRPSRRCAVRRGFRALALPAAGGRRPSRRGERTGPPVPGTPAERPAAERVPTVGIFPEPARQPSESGPCPRRGRTRSPPPPPPSRRQRRRRGRRRPQRLATRTTRPPTRRAGAGIRVVSAARVPCSRAVMRGGAGRARRPGLPRRRGRES